MNLGLGALLDFVWIGFELNCTWYDMILFWFDVDWIWFDWTRVWFDVRVELKSNVHENAPMSNVEDFMKIWIRRSFG